MHSQLDPVLLCGAVGDENPSTFDGISVQSSTNAALSVKESVQIANANNFMGLVIPSRLLVSLHIAEGTASIMS